MISVSAEKKIRRKIKGENCSEKSKKMLSVFYEEMMPCGMK